MKDEFIYILENPSFKGLKIGFSNNVQSRIDALNTGSPTDFALVKKFKVESGFLFEKIVHRELSSYKMKREFFLLKPQEAIKKVEEAIRIAETERLEDLGAYKKEIKDSDELVDILISQRKLMGATQLELATLCNMSENGISKMESKKGTPKLNSLFKLMGFLGIRFYITYER